MGNEAAAGGANPMSDRVLWGAVCQWSSYVCFFPLGAVCVWGFVREEKGDAEADWRDNSIPWASSLALGRSQGFEVHGSGTVGLALCQVWCSLLCCAWIRLLCPRGNSENGLGNSHLG